MFLLVQRLHEDLTLTAPLNCKQFAAAFLAAFICLPAPASAAEAVADAYDWTGAYVGAVAGAGLFDTNFNDASENISYGSLDISDWGWAAGLTVGGNWQSGSMVLGIEADFNWSNFEIDELHNAYSGNFNGGPTQHDRSWEWFATLRGRAGLAVDQTLLYVTGGLALVEVDFKGDYDPPNACGQDYGYCLEKRMVGLAVGAGAEFGMGEHASLKLEGLWIGLPTETADDVFDNDEDNYHVNSSVALARVGLNWRF
jgi:outer membrane immunogenic protein